MKRSLKYSVFAAVMVCPVIAAETTPVLKIQFDGSVSGATYSLAPGELDTTGTFKASATPTVTSGRARLEGGVNVNGTAQDGFDFNPTSLGSLTSQNWVAEAVVEFSSIQSGLRTILDVQGDVDLRINSNGTSLQMVYWDGSNENVVTSGIPVVGETVHFALVWNAAASSLTAYVDGVAIGTADGGAFAVPDATNVSFGYFGRAGFDNRGIDGWIDGAAFATFTGVFDAATDFQLFSPAPPTDYVYWDINGPVAGAGGDVPGGAWGGNHWSSTPAGTGSTAAWIGGANAAFSAGDDATGQFQVDLGGVVREVGSILVEEGDVLLYNGTLSLTEDALIEVTPFTFLEITASLRGGNVESDGTVYVGGDPEITGVLNIASGQWNLDAALECGGLAGAGILSMGFHDLMIESAGTSTFSGRLDGSGTVTKAGTGVQTFGNVLNSFTGPLVISSGTLVTGAAAGDGSVGYLGSVQGDREIQVLSDAVLRLTQANVFGGRGKTFDVIPSYVISGGNLETMRFNIVGDVTLSSGGVLTNSSTETDPDYGGFQLLGTIRAEGVGEPCEILDFESSRPIHLLGGGVTVMEVADVTLSGAADLVVSCDIADGSGDYGGMSSLEKTGSGTLSLSGANSYSGSTTVTGGTLMVHGAALSDGGSLILNGGKVAPVGIETVGTLFFGEVQQESGTWGASGSGAEHIDDARFTGEDGVVAVLVGPSAGYVDWAAGFDGFEETGADLDFDSDGLANGIEWVLGSDPTVPDGAQVGPAFDAVSDEDSVIFVFRRQDDANEDPNSVIKVEYGSDLAGWSEASNGIDGVIVTSTDDGFEAGVDEVTVMIPRDLAEGGSLFVRLSVTISP